MEISKAEISDAEMILGIQQLAYISEAKHYNDFKIPPLTQTLKSLQSEFTTHVFLKAIVDSMVVGSVRGIEKNGICYLGRLMVLPRFQGKGIGAALLLEIEKYYSNVKRFELFTGSSSVENIHFYKKLGYKEFKLEPLNDNVTFVYMEKLIQ
jgi:ribosomal protein S18 acetylase RimI-like enzyme